MHSAKFSFLRLTQWSKINEAFEVCSSFVSSARALAKETLTILCQGCDPGGKESTVVLADRDGLMYVGKDFGSSKHNSIVVAVPGLFTHVAKTLAPVNTVTSQLPWIFD